VDSFGRPRATRAARGPSPARGWLPGVAVAALVCLLASVAGHAADDDARPIDTRAFAADVDQFLAREVTAHFAAIPTLDPPPDRVLGARTVGDFSWGTFMRTLAAYAQHAGVQTLAGRDVPQWIARMGLIEARAGSKTFSQLYAALALRHFGEQLSGSNAVWQRLTPGEREEWRALLDVRRFYDPVARRVIDLPENYLGVAARTAAIGYRLGIASDRAPLDALVDRAAGQFTSGHLFSDDSPPTGRYDRYSNEYARYVWEAASLADRADILQALRPSLTTQMRLWWDLVNEDGYGYQWGRSLGVISYLDTLEIVAFLAEHPEFRPAPLADLVSLYARAWRWLRRDYQDDRRLLSVFAFGRGNFAYITLDREWQQTTGFFGKAQVANVALEAVMAREGLTMCPAKPALGAVARFQFFRADGNRPAGVWVVRQGPLRFALPITTGTRPAVADYLPAPHGLGGFAAPVERDVPALVPYLDLRENETIVTSDGADGIYPSADGRELRVVWRRWARVGAQAGELVDPGLASEVRWTIHDDGALERVETLTARAQVTIRAWRLIVPSTAATATVAADSTLLSGTEGRLGVQVRTPWAINSQVLATGDDPAGRGPRGPIPLHLVYDARDVKIAPGRPLTWRLTLHHESP
jgi:hypothetical protein